MFGGVPVTWGQGSSEKAVAIYADAASFQNNGAFALAAEEWRKLIQQFPDDPLASQARHYLGVSLIQLDPPELDEAIEVFRQAVQDEKLSVRPEALINLGWCLYTRARNAPPESPAQIKDLREAQQVFEEFVAKYPQSAYMDQALFYLGDAHYMLGRAEQAVQFYKKMLQSAAAEKSPLRPDALYALAVAYQELAQDSDARQTYEKFLQAYSDHPLAQEVRVRLADLLIAAGNPQAAEELLLTVARSQPPHELADYAWLRLGYARARQDRSADALAAYQRLLADFPASPHRRAAALLAGQILFNQGKFEPAIDRLQLAAEQRDELAADAVHWIAQAYLQLKQPAEALQTVDAALQWVPPETSMPLKMDRAEALYALPDRLADAYAAYVQAATEFPDHPATPRAVYNAALTALQLKQLEDAQRWAELFLERFPSDPLRSDVAYVAAETMLLQGRHDAAIDAYRELLRTNPNDPSGTLWTLRLATALYLADRFDQAIEVLEPVMADLTSDEQRAEAHYILGACRLYQEQTPAAIDHLRRSLEASRDWNSADEVTLLLAEALQQSGDRAGARQMLQDFLRRYPDSPQRPQAEYRLAQLRADEGAYDAAIRGYESIVADPSAAHLHRFAKYGMAWCAMQQQRYASAVPILQGLIAETAQDSIAAESRLALGICQRKLDRTDEAIDTLRKFVQLQPPPTALAAGWHELGLALTQARKLDDANAALRKCLEIDPRYPARSDVLYELAWNLHDSGRTEEAAETFAELAEAFPQTALAAEALYMLAQYHYDQD
ncbi:MAG: outer membrane protein assembly factor BamD, partial [Planctomycetota bacterium]